MIIQTTNSSHGRLPAALAVIAAAAGLLLAVQAQAIPTAAQPTVPTLSTPANGATDWLFNRPSNGRQETLSWTAALGASKYEVVVSRQSNFRDAIDTSVGVVCLASCTVRMVTTTSARDVDFSGYWWESGTHYWRVRAIYATSRGAWSPPRSFVTARKPDIVVNAMMHFVSPPSLVRAVGRPWLDETYDRDGARLRSAMQTYRAAKDKRLGSPVPGSSTPPTLLATTMIGNLAGSAVPWSATSRWSLIVKIADTEGTSPVPTTDQGTLDRLGVRAQCKEFADRMVTAGGGTATIYPLKSPQGVIPEGRSDPRPGMYVFRVDCATCAMPWGHAAIANAIRIEVNGSRSARLTEANASSNVWSNPGGEVPWQRTVRHTDVRTLSTTAQFRAYSN